MRVSGYTVRVYPIGRPLGQDAPSDAAWRRAAQVIGSASGNAFNDALLACQAREHG